MWREAIEEIDITVEVKSGSEKGMGKRGEGKDSKEEMGLKSAEVCKDIRDVTGKGDSLGKM